MIELLLIIHKHFYGNNARFHYKERGNRIMWIICNLISKICVVVLFFYMKFRGKTGKVSKNKKAIRNDEIIVSLTSFPKRINNVWMVIDSICRQTMQPAFISLTLSEQEFPNKEQDLPMRLLHYKRFGLRINWLKNNMMPHGKYLYIMQNSPNKYIITIDDDIYYRKDLVEHLWNISQQFKGSVCANTVSAILDYHLSTRPYNQWSSTEVVAMQPSHNYIAKGYNGVIYPPYTFKNEAAFDETVISETCLRADDLWLKAQEVINDVQVVWGGYYPTAIELNGSQRISLKSTNISEIERGNDKQWNSIDRVLKINKLLRDRLENKKENHVI